MQFEEHLMAGSLRSAEVSSPAKPFLAVGESSVDSLMSNTGFDILITLLSTLKRPLHPFFLTICCCKSYLYFALRLTEIEVQIQTFKRKEKHPVLLSRLCCL